MTLTPFARGQGAVSGHLGQYAHTRPITWRMTFHGHRTKRTFSLIKVATR